jgi:DNA-binding PadR family transcriptional regulator
MYAHAIHATEAGGWRGRDPRALGGLWRAMSGGGHWRGETRGRHRRREYGGGPWGGFGGFPFGGFGPGGPFGRGRKARRGDIRTAALLLVAEEPRNGYQIMQEVEERSEGAWRPSPGSVYPALQQLEDEGLIRAEEIDGRKLFKITDAGRAYVQERGEQPAPWEQMGADVSDQASEMGKLVRDIAFAFAQVMRTGSDAQIARARDLLVTTRREIYRILGNGDAESAEPRQEV